MPRPKLNTDFINEVNYLGEALAECQVLIETNIFTFANKVYEECKTGKLYNVATKGAVRNIPYIDSDHSTQEGGFGYKTLAKWTRYLTDLLARTSYIQSLNSNPVDDMTDLAIALDMRKQTGTFRKSIKAFMALLFECSQEVSVTIDVVELIFNAGLKQTGKFDYTNGHTMWTYDEVYTTMECKNITQSKFSYEDIIKELLQIDILVEKKGYLSTHSAFEAEKRIHKCLKSDSSVTIPRGESIFELSKSQIDWGERTFNSGNKLQTGTGYAGTGKTVTTSAYINGGIAAGLTISAMAPTGMASLVLQKSLEANGVDTSRLAGGRVRTVDSAIWTPEQKNEIHPNVIIIDEASMLSSEKLADVIIRWPEAKLILLGDPSQLGPIETGYPFRDIIHITSPIAMTEVRRTDDERMKKAFENIRKGRIDLSVFLEAIPFGGKKKCDGVPISRGLLKPLIKFVHQCISEGVDESGFTKCLMMAKTNRLVDAINSLALHIKLHGLVYDKAQYTKACLVVYAYYNIKVPDSIAPDLLERGNVFEVGTPVIWNDDRVDFKTPYGKDMIYRGFPGIVVEKDTLRILTINNRTGAQTHKLITISDYAESISPSYCLTVNKAQGSTYETAVVFMRQNWKKMSNGYWKSSWEGQRLYTALTRASNTAKLVSFDAVPTDIVDWETNHRDTLLYRFGGKR